MGGKGGGGWSLVWLLSSVVPSISLKFSYFDATSRRPLSTRYQLKPPCNQSEFLYCS